MRKIMLFIGCAALALAALCVPSMRARAGGIDQFGNQTTSPQGVGPDSKAHQLAVDTDGTLHVTVTGTSTCAAIAQNSGTVGTTAALFSTQLTGRRYIEICNSVENSTNPTLKVLLDADPVIGAGGAGYALAVGGCKTFPVDATHVPHLLGSADGVGYEIFECS